MDEKTRAYVTFSHFLGIGPIKFQALIKHFETVEKAYLASLFTLKEVLGENLAHQLIDFKKELNFKELEIKFKKKNINIIHQENKLFPKNLLDIPDSPICLYVKGNLYNFIFDQNIISIVGTRMPTSYGEKVTKDIAYSLVGAGFKISSGLAIGIDSIAHSTCIECGGQTVAFLGCGVDIVYPISNEWLYNLILEKDGLIISEFPPGMTVLKGLFVARNRLISAAAKAVIVVEGSEKSGSLITAKYTVEQGKEVFAVPGSITSVMSRAPNLLIREGARPLISVEELLQDFNIKNSIAISKIDRSKLNSFEKNVIKYLENGPKNTDEIYKKSKKTLALILQTLTSLEMKGYIIKSTDGKYSIV
ncbi:MAG: DNA-processing protein DprA [bacterium]